MCKVLVVNKYKHDPGINDVYIGRGSCIGNPYSHLDSKFDDIIKVDSREEAISCYRLWLKREIIRGNSNVLQELNRIKDKYKKYGSVNLVCFCKPKACHGDIIKEIIENGELSEQRGAGVCS